MSTDVKQKLWKISLSMTSFYGAQTDIENIDSRSDFWEHVNNDKAEITPELVFGVSNKVKRAGEMSHYEQTKYFMSQMYAINNGIELKYSLQNFLQGSKVKLAFDARRKLVGAMPYKERTQLLKSLERSSTEFRQYSLVIEYDKALPAQGILGYDLAHYANICRLGGYLGYLSESEIFTLLQEPAVLAQNSFSGFEEYGLSSTIGILFHSGQKVYEKFLANLHLALQHKNSYWTHLEWTTPLNIAISKICYNQKGNNNSN